MKRVLLTLGLIVLLLVIGGGVFVWFSVRSLSNPDYLVQQIEESLNCRAEVTTAELDLLRAPAQLMLTGIAFGPRDAYAEERTPLAERPPLQGSVTIDFAMLELDRTALFSKKLVVRNLTLERPQVDVTIFDNGRTSLDELILPPKKAKSSKPSEPMEEGAKPKADRFSVERLPISAIADEMLIDNITIHATVEKSKTTVQLHEGVIILSDIDIDPDSLGEHNSANIDFAAWIGVDSFEHNMRYLDISMEGNGAIQPFEVETGLLNPSVSAAVTVLKDSWMDALPLLDEMEDLMGQLKEYGVDTDGIRLRGDFSEDTETSFNVSREKLQMTSDFLVPIDENFLILQRDSWVNAGDESHEFFFSFVGSERLTTKIEEEVKKHVKDQFGSLAAEIVITGIMTPLKKGDFLLLRFRSEGVLGNPKVNWVTPYGDIGTLIKNTKEANPMKTLEESAKGLLQQLLGNDGIEDESEESGEP